MTTKMLWDNYQVLFHLFIIYYNEIILKVYELLCKLIMTNLNKIILGIFVYNLYVLHFFLLLQ